MQICFSPDKDKDTYVKGAKIQGYLLVGLLPLQGKERKGKAREDTEKMEKSPPILILAPLLLKNLLRSIFILADKSLLYLCERHKLLELMRCFIESIVLLVLKLLPYLFSSFSPPGPGKPLKDPSFNPQKYDNHSAVSGAGAGGNSGVFRALSQLLLIMNDVPVSSRKYEMVRSLAEKLIDENLVGGNRALREVNCTVLLTAFQRTLIQLEGALVNQGQRFGGEDTAEAVGGTSGRDDPYLYENGVGRFLKGVRSFGHVVWRYATLRGNTSWSKGSAEKLAAELLWLAKKMVASGCGEEAVCRWAYAVILASLALFAEPRIQCSLVRASEFLIKQTKDMSDYKEQGDDSPLNQQRIRIREAKMKILTSWLPLLCRANRSTDAPILNTGERAELERTIETLISELDETEQECVLSIWLHHYTYCPASDWPNLHSCYSQWYSASRKRLVSVAS